MIIIIRITANNHPYAYSNLQACNIIVMLVTLSLGVTSNIVNLQKVKDNTNKLTVPLFHD